MKAPIDALLQVERSVAAEKGPFALFALFLREEAPGVWDVVVSAPWIEEDMGTALKLISERLRQSLSPSDLIGISKIVPVDPLDPAVEAINRTVRVEGSAVEVRDATFFGQRIEHAYILASNPIATHAKQPASEYALQRTRRKRARR